MHLIVDYFIEYCVGSRFSRTHFIADMKNLITRQYEENFVFEPKKKNLQNYDLSVA